MQSSRGSPIKNGLDSYDLARYVAELFVLADSQPTRHSCYSFPAMDIIPSFLSAIFHIFFCRSDVGICDSICLSISRFVENFILAKAKAACMLNRARLELNLPSSAGLASCLVVAVVVRCLSAATWTDSASNLIG